MYILNLETATKNCSVSVAKNGQTVFCKQLASEGYSHAELLHVFIEEVLKTVKISFQDLSAIAVSKGPGSYTGLRIGVAAAKGICYACNIPLIAVDTLQILAKQITIKQGVIVPMLDARRMEVYSAHYDQNYEKIREVQAEIIDENWQYNYKKIHIIGDCQSKIKTILDEKNIVFFTQIEYPSANEMGFLSYQKFQNKSFEDLAYFEPLYLKDFFLTTSHKKCI